MEFLRQQQGMSTLDILGKQLSISIETCTILKELIRGTLGSSALNLGAVILRFFYRSFFPFLAAGEADFLTLRGNE